MADLLLKKIPSTACLAGRSGAGFVGSTLLRRRRRLGCRARGRIGRVRARLAHEPFRLELTREEACHQLVVAGSFGTAHRPLLDEGVRLGHEGLDVGAILGAELAQLGENRG